MCVYFFPPVPPLCRTARLGPQLSSCSLCGEVRQGRTVWVAQVMEESELSRHKGQRRFGEKE